MVVHHKITSYYPRGNAQVKIMNKILIALLTKICELKRNDWEHKLHATLWAYRPGLKTFTGQAPFQFTYGIEIVMTTQYVVPSLRIVVTKRMGDVESNNRRLTTLENLTEARKIVIHAMIIENMRKRKMV